MKKLVLSATVAGFALAAPFAAFAGGLDAAEEEDDVVVAAATSSSAGALPLLLGVGGLVIVGALASSDSSNGTN